MNNKVNNIITGASILVVLMLVFFILRKLGLTSKKKSEIDVVWEDTILDTYKASETLKDTQFLNPNYWRGKRFPELTNDQLQTLAKRLYNAFDNWTFLPPFGDNEPEIYAVFESLNFGTQLSQLSEQFQKMYGESLRGRLFEQLDSTELRQVALIINGYAK